jgi:hypothetical protein
LYIPPASKSLNIARGHMPQIEYKNQADFVGFLKNKGYKAYIDPIKVDEIYFTPSN